VGEHHPGGEQVQITLRALPDTVPLAIRLRAVLKFALRSCRLRCVALKDVAGDCRADRGGDRPAERKCAKNRPAVEEA
jgi:hypothetical protein